MADGWSFAQNVFPRCALTWTRNLPLRRTFEKVLNLIDFFQCPRGVIPVATLVLGYPEAGDGSPQRVRLDTSSMVHRERYEVADDKSLAVAYKDKENADSADLREGVSSVARWSPDPCGYLRPMKYPKVDMDLSERIILLLFESRDSFSAKS